MDQDDDFDAIVSDLSLDDETINAIVDVTTLNAVELNRLYNQCRQELLARGEMLNPTSEKGRELHSLRAACVIALRSRGLV